jgi:hypothetical protein
MVIGLSAWLRHIESKNAVLPIDAAIQLNLRETTTRVLAAAAMR